MSFVAIKSFRRVYSCFLISSRPTDLFTIPITSWIMGVAALSLSIAVTTFQIARAIAVIVAIVRWIATVIGIPIRIVPRLCYFRPSFCLSSSSSIQGASSCLVVRVSVLASWTIAIIVVDTLWVRRIAPIVVTTIVAVVVSTVVTTVDSFRLVEISPAVGIFSLFKVF